MLSYDSSAIALSFLPAAGEASSSPSSLGERAEATEDLEDAEIVRDDAFTYHHLRRSIYDLCTKAGVEVASRYTVPSAHLTIARFVTQDDIIAQGRNEIQPADEGVATEPVAVDQGKVKRLVDEIEKMNTWLEEEYWPKDGKKTKKGGEWIVGERKGLDCRRGTLWYGGGETIRLGKGF